MALLGREIILLVREMVLVGREMVLVVREMVLVGREMDLVVRKMNLLLLMIAATSLYDHPARRTQQLFSQLLHSRKNNISHLLGRPLIRKTGISDGLIDIVKSGKERDIEV